MQIQSRLFDFDFGAGVFELLGDFFGFGLCNAFLDGLGSAFDEGFCVRKAVGSDCADFLNDRDFLRSVNSFENDVERILFFNGSRRRTACYNSNRSRRFIAPFVFELFYESCNVLNRKAAEPFDNLIFCNVCHGDFLLWTLSIPLGIFKGIIPLRMSF